MPDYPPPRDVAPEPPPTAAELRSAARPHLVFALSWAAGATASVPEDGPTFQFSSGFYVLYQQSWLELGVGNKLQFGTSAHSEIPEFLGGIALETGRHTRFELLAEGGAEIIHDVYGVASNITGTNQALFPYFGGQVAFSHKKDAGLVGVFFSAGDAVGTQTIRPFPGGGTTLGGPSLAVGLRVAYAVDL